MTDLVTPEPQPQPAPAPEPMPRMTAEEWYAADIAARAALAEATAARHVDWIAECARAQSRHADDMEARRLAREQERTRQVLIVDDIAARTRCALATEAQTAKMQALHEAIIAMPAGDGVPIQDLITIIKALSGRP